MKRLSFMCKIMLALSLIVVSTFGFASAKNGNGSGSGKNSGQALAVQTSSVKSGDKDVYKNNTIDLTFSKNVVNLSVMENNSKCFHLCDKDGNVVSIKITFPDDQVKPDYKNHVFVTPEKELTANSEYTLVIDKALTAKNQTTLKEDYKLAFTTGNQTTKEVNPILKELKDDVKTYTNQLPLNKAENNKKAETTTKKVAKKTDAKPAEKKNNTTRNIIIAVAIVLVLLIALFMTKNQKPKTEEKAEETK